MKTKQQKIISSNLPVSGSFLLAELMKRADEKNLNGQPVIRDVSDKFGGGTKYVRYDAMVYELNKLNKQKLSKQK